MKRKHLNFLINNSMNILTEIIEVSDEIIDTLKEEKFFEETPFINELALKRELQKHMQYNW
jgi:hypothetical protein